jgi:hypothetical protein
MESLEAAIASFDADAEAMLADLHRLAAAERDEALVPPPPLVPPAGGGGEVRTQCGAENRDEAPPVTQASADRVELEYYRDADQLQQLLEEQQYDSAGVRSDGRRMKLNRETGEVKVASSSCGARERRVAKRAAERSALDAQSEVSEKGKPDETAAKGRQKGKPDETAAKGSRKGKLGKTAAKGRHKSKPGKR